MPSNPQLSGKHIPLDSSNTPEEWRLTGLHTFLTQYQRREEIRSDVFYERLGVKWYALGPYKKETVIGESIKAKYLNRVLPLSFIYNRLFAWKGSFGLIGNDMANCYVSSEFPLFRINEKIADPYYIWYWFSQPGVWKYIEDKSSGSTRTSRLRFKEEDFLAITIPLPPLEEQLVISAILSTIRKSILATEQVINAIQTLKRAIMKHLFTYGPIPVDQADQVKLKDTEIGEIPEEWKTAKISEVCNVNAFSCDPRSERVDEEFIYIDISSIDNGTGQITSPTRMTGRNAPSRARRLIQTGDVILSMVRPYLKAHAIVPEEFNNQICSTGFAVLSCKNAVSSEYLLNISMSDIVGKQFLSKMKGANYPAISQNDVSFTKIPIPSYEEQIDIGNYLTVLDKKIVAESGRKSALDILFSSLLQHLMAGTVRVQVD